MEVVVKIKNVLRTASVFINMEKEFQPLIENGVDGAEENLKDEFCVFEKALNLAHQEICERLSLKFKKEVSVLNGEISYENIDEKVKRIFVVKDCSTLKNIKFVESKSKILVDDSLKRVLVVYSKIPQELLLDEDVFLFNGKVSEKCFALCIASEYFYIKSFYEEAEIFYKRFKELLKLSINKFGGVFLPKRRWN